jgi:cysteinyl-tRNA synthetase
LIKKVKINKKYIEKFKEEISDDLNMPKALAVLWELIRDEKIKSGDKTKTIEEMDKVLGLDLLKEEKIQIPKEIKNIAEERQKARENKDWKKSDELRDILKEKGWIIKDTKDGWELEKRE